MKTIFRKLRPTTASTRMKICRLFFLMLWMPAVTDAAVHGEGQAEIVRVKPVVNQYMQKKVPGFVRDGRFENIVIAGADPEHDVRDVIFENLSIFGDNLTRNAPRMSAGPHVGEVRFAGPSREEL